MRFPCSFLTPTGRRAMTTSVAAPVLPEISFKPAKWTGMSYEKARELRTKHFSPSQTHFYKDPLYIVQGHMQYLFDHTGRRYLDAFGGIVTVGVGHCHPYVNAAAKEQLDKLHHTTVIYLTEPMGKYAEKIIAKMPKGSGLDTVFFVNSGSEANDVAITLTRLYTGNFDIIALRNGYHGMSPMTMGLTSHSTWKYNIPHGEGIKHALWPCPYRGVFGAGPDAGQKYADEVKNLISFGTSGQVAGFWAEPIQGVGGCVPLVEGFLPKAYAHIRNAGGLNVSDEVQTGWGRLGSHFWGFEKEGVTPDIAVCAKSIGNGIPLACVITRKEIISSLAKRIHFNTYSGSQVPMAMGMATLEVIERENLQENSRIVGEYLKNGLKELQKKHTIIGDVRGSGLLLGMELVKDRTTKEPATAEHMVFFEKCRELGLLVGKGGIWGNVCRIAPPMCMTKADAKFMLEVMDVALRAI